MPNFRIPKGDRKHSPAAKLGECDRLLSDLCIYQISVHSEKADRLTR
ncbi:MAG: hypothetical protein LRZ84_10385 [Desertifilum sp.]|nr:hypothetical protein [Desertifilum sp.]